LRSIQYRNTRTRTIGARLTRNPTRLKPAGGLTDISTSWSISIVVRSPAKDTGYTEDTFVRSFNVSVTVADGPSILAWTPCPALTCVTSSDSGTVLADGDGVEDSAVMTDAAITRPPRTPRTIRPGLLASHGMRPGRGSGRGSGWAWARSSSVDGDAGVSWAGCGDGIAAIVPGAAQLPSDRSCQRPGTCPGDQEPSSAGGTALSG